MAATLSALTIRTNVAADIAAVAAEARLAALHVAYLSYDTHLLRAGYDVRAVQTLLGHVDVHGTMAYTQLLPQGGGGVESIG
ncbi:tyrosine-type recombinase/integrase [Xylophilus sp. GW821-FHT01B05]